MEIHKQHRQSVTVWTSEAIVSTYLSFFAEHGHLQLPGSSLIAPDSSTYFTVAGMQPLLPYLQGRQTPPSPRLSSLQRCLRTVDVTETGRTGRKLTSFHMLGNWSVGGSYGKREAIELAIELLHTFGLDFQRLWITTFGGDLALNLPPDECTVSEWLRQGFPEQRVISLGLEDNFWDLGRHLPGPCGPCTEMFFDFGPEYSCGRPTCRPGCSCERFLEIWNLVFIEYNRSPEGELTRLPFVSVDTGMGLERIATVLQGVPAPSSFDIDLFRPAGELLDQLVSSHGEISPQPELCSRRLILDHARSALFACLEGILPGQENRNSVIRRLFRRAIRQGHQLGIKSPFLFRFIDPLLQTHSFLLTSEQQEQITRCEEIFVEEEKQFARTLNTGLKILETLKPDERGLIAGEAIFHLYSDRGFPLDLAAEILEERGLTIDWPGYEQALVRHRQVSRRSLEKQFRHS